MPKIKAPLPFALYRARYPAFNEGWPAYETALKANNKAYTAYIYDNVNHGFHNDTTPHDKAAAELAWQRTIDFINEHLK